MPPRAIKPPADDVADALLGARIATLAAERASLVVASAEVQASFALATDPVVKRAAIEELKRLDRDIATVEGKETALVDARGKANSGKKLGLAHDAAVIAADAWLAANLVPVQPVP